MVKAPVAVRNEGTLVALFAAPAPATRPPVARRRGTTGFTLVEILLAATMGALLLIATASSAGLFGKQLSYLKEQTNPELTSVVASMSDDVRYAWWASVPNARQLVLADPAGGQTVYTLGSGQLTVKRPDNSSGLLLDDIKLASFTPQTLTRYREAAPVLRSGQFWGAAAPAGVVAQAQIVEPGDRLALGFTATSPAPINGTTPGITDQLVDTTLGSMNLTVAAVGTVAPILGTLNVDLYRARSPGDARPEGSRLAGITVATIGLPTVAGSVYNTKTKKNVKIPGGVAWGWWKTKSVQVLITPAPTIGVPLDLTALASKVKPGYAYTLVISTSLSGVAVAAYPIGSAVKSGVALDKAGGGYVAQSLSVPRSLSGDLNMTRTTATDVTSRVLVDITLNDGTQLSTSTLVLGQSMADDAWLGVIPGELGP